MLLDLGSGPRPRYGHQGVDKVFYPDIAWQCDLQKFPWVFRPILKISDGTLLTDVMPMDFTGEWYGKSHRIGEEPCVPDNIVEGANANQLVEHVVDLVGFMAELWRVCKDGAEVTIQHPYQFNVRAWQDPTHVRCLNEVSFFYFDKQAGWNRGEAEYGPTDFAVLECDAIPSPEWSEKAKEDPAEFERAAHNMINVIADLRWTLRARK